MTINAKTGKIVKPKTLTQKMKTAQVKKHNKALGVKPKKSPAQSKSKR